MKIFTIFLCVFVNYVTSQTRDIVEAKILVQQKTISENSILFATCSTFGMKKNTSVHIHLLKDDTVIYTKVQKQGHNDTNFIINRAGLNHSGNYSCFSSKSSKIKVARSNNSLKILVIDISVAGPSSVSEGDNVELRCTVSDTLQTLGGCRLIQSYLMKNESILQVQTFNVTQKEATFTIKSAVMRDSGHYSCVVLPSKCVEEHETKLNGNNAVLVEVKEVLFFRVILICGGVTMLLSLSLCMWRQAGCSAPCKQHATSDLENTIVLEEQQVHTDGEDLEDQDYDSFAVVEEEEVYQMDTEKSLSHGNAEDMYSVADSSAVVKREEVSYQMDAGDSLSHGDGEDPYSVADDPPVQQHPECLYAGPFKQTKTPH